MQKKLLILSTSLLLLAACSPEEQKAINDALDEDTEAEVQVEADTETEDPSVEAEMNAWEEGGENPSPTPTQPEPTTEEPDAQARGSYAAYSSNVLTDGAVKVLFFHAAWCPICKVQDTELQAWYAEREIPLTVYKVDYDANADLKAKYGVTYQHTFVKVDGQGNMIEKIQGPSDEQLLDLLGA